MIRLRQFCGGRGRAVLIVLVAVSAGATDACAQRVSRTARAELAVAVPDSFLVSFETSRGRFDVMARTYWAPVGVDRFYYLVRHGYYDDQRFFRVIRNFVAQFGISGNPAVNRAWKVRRIADDSVRHSNTRGTVAFARSARPGTRTVQLFINLRDNPRLDALNGFGFAPIAEVVSGMRVVDSLYSGYGEAATPTRTDTLHRGPSQDSIAVLGTPYLVRGWPKLDVIRRAHVVREWRSTGASRDK